jgi:hypothetical protein
MGACRKRLCRAPLHGGLDLVVDPNESTFRVHGFISALPETERDMLTAGLDVRDSAAAVSDHLRESGLAVPGGAAAGR